MFKVGDIVICTDSHTMAPELFRGRPCTITDVRYEERDDSYYMVGVKESFGMYSSKLFEHYEVYHRKDKIIKLKDNIKRSQKHRFFSF